MSPFIIGYIISLALNPLADYFNKTHKVHRGIAAFFLIVISLLLLVTLGTMLVSKIRQEIETFSLNFPSLSAEIIAAINNIRLSLSELLDIFPDEIRTGIDGALSQLASAAAGIFGSVVKTGSINAVSTIPGILMNLILGIVSAFFFIKDKYLIKDVLSKRLAFLQSGNIAAIKQGLLTAVGGYFKAQLMIMAVVGSICILGLTIMGNPYAIIIGLLVSMIDALPVFGTGTIFWPWILFSLATGNTMRAISLAIIYCVAFLANQFLAPKLVGQQIGIHPLLTLMSIYIGLSIFGVLGLLLGPVIAVSAKVLFSQTGDD